MGHSPKRVLVWGPRRDARPAGERRSGGALEGYPKRKRGDPTWSAARDDAYAQKERPAGEAYRPSPSGDFAPPLGDYNLDLKILLLLFFTEKERPRWVGVLPKPCTRPHSPPGDHQPAPKYHNKSQQAFP